MYIVHHIAGERMFWMLSNIRSAFALTAVIAACLLHKILLPLFFIYKMFKEKGRRMYRKRIYNYTCY